jgi:hypothetical protein
MASLGGRRKKVIATWCLCITQLPPLRSVVKDFCLKGGMVEAFRGALKFNKH